MPNDSVLVWAFSSGQVHIHRISMDRELLWCTRNQYTERGRLQSVWVNFVIFKICHICILQSEEHADIIFYIYMWNTFSQNLRDQGCLWEQGHGTWCGVKWFTHFKDCRQLMWAHNDTTAHIQEVIQLAFIQMIMKFQKPLTWHTLRAHTHTPRPRIKIKLH
jgi:hypothetical protein